MTVRRIKRRARVVTRRAFLFLRTHHFTLLSVAIISILFGLAMTSDAFVSRERSPTLQPGPAQSVVAVAPAASSQPAGDPATPTAFNLTVTDAGAIYRWAQAQPMR